MIGYIIMIAIILAAGYWYMNREHEIMITSGNNTFKYNVAPSDNSKQTNTFVVALMPKKYKVSELAHVLQEELNKRNTGWTVNWSVDDSKFIIQATAEYDRYKHPNTIYDAMQLPALPESGHTGLIKAETGISFDKK